MDNYKVHYNERRHDSTVFDSLKGPIISQERYHSNKASSIVLGESIRGHFDEKYSDTYDFKGIKIVGHQEHSADFIDRGKKYIAHKETPNDKFTPTVKQFHGIANLPSAPATRISQHWTGKTRVKQIESDTYNLEGGMNRKQRIFSNGQQRNEIPTATLGDKYYKSADQERDFYKKGGLIPGSCISAQKTGKIEFRKTNDFRHSNTIMRPALSFEEKEKISFLKNELYQLRTLNNSSELLGQEVPSWEKRTGFYLVKPEDENY